MTPVHGVSSPFGFFPPAKVFFPILKSQIKSNAYNIIRQFFEKL
jgi:hypothetical protein